MGCHLAQLCGMAEYLMQQHSYTCIITWAVSAMESSFILIKVHQQRIVVRLKWTQQLYATYHCLLLFLFTLVLFLYKNHIQNLATRPTNQRFEQSPYLIIKTILLWRSLFKEVAS